MFDPYERGIVLSYIARALRHLSGKGRRGKEFRRWLDEHSDWLPVEEFNGSTQSAASGDERCVCDWDALQTLVGRNCHATGASRPDRLGRHIQFLGQAMELGSHDVALLEAALRYDTQPVVEELFGEFGKAFGESWNVLNCRSRTLACLLGITRGQLEECLSEGGPLVRTGLVTLDDDGDFTALRRLRRMAFASAGRPDPKDVRRLLLGANVTSELDWRDFEHLGEAREDVARLLRGAIDGGERGVNVLLYGPPGTGKTEFCRTLAEHVGAELFGVGEADDHGREPSRHERLAELRLAQSLLAGDSTGVLLVDEMEDLLRGTSVTWVSRSGARREERGGYSKVFMHRLLEGTPVPTLWTTNQAGSMDPALLRRMMFVLEVRQPPARIRARIWSRQLERRGIEATSAEALALAREFDASPGVATGAVAAAAISDGDVELVRRGVRSLSRLLRQDRPIVETGPVDPDLLEADIDLADLAERLMRRGERHFSICLQGPPGTGKSAYARHLASCLGLDVVQKRASDLFGMFVGETEENIARAFADARADEAFLIFDEADSFLADRRGAQRSWEISQVNEMLTWMEAHPLPFACTTNYGDRLDPAVLRRFTFKVTLGYLGTHAARELFRRYFEAEAPPRIDRLTVLAPGDFPVVRRKAEVLGNLDDRDALLEMLREECSAKPDQPAPIGFARS